METFNEFVTHLIPLKRFNRTLSSFSQTCHLLVDMGANKVIYMGVEHCFVFEILGGSR